MSNNILVFVHTYNHAVKFTFIKEIEDFLTKETSVLNFANDALVGDKNRKDSVSIEGRITTLDCDGNEDEMCI